MFQNNNLERAMTAMIAVLLVAATITISLAFALHTGSSEVPQWLGSSTTLVIGYYFGNHKSLLTQPDVSQQEPPQPAQKPLSAGAVPGNTNQ